MNTDKCLECDTILAFENCTDRVICKNCLNKNTIHKQVESKFGSFIDEELVDLINIFYDIGIMTNNSCQNQENKRYKNKTWICFNSLKDVEKFFQVSKSDYTFYDYVINQDWEIIVDPIHILNTSMYEYSLRFPYEDLSYFKESVYGLYKLLTQSSRCRTTFSW